MIGLIGAAICFGLLFTAIVVTNVFWVDRKI